MTLADEQATDAAPDTAPTGVTLPDILAEVHGLRVAVHDLRVTHLQVLASLDRVRTDQQSIAALLGQAFTGINAHLVAVGLQLTELQGLAGRAAPLLDHPAAKFGRLFHGRRAAAEEGVTRATEPQD